MSFFDKYDMAFVGSEVQTRDCASNLKLYNGDNRLTDAVEAADNNGSIWKISFDYKGKPLRILRGISGWEETSLEDVVVKSEAYIDAIVTKLVKNLRCGTTHD